jgi:hypothetical protein
MIDIAIIIFGDGGELGSFKVFSDTLRDDLKNKYKKVVVKYVNRDYDFVSSLLNIPDKDEKIAELHIFCHAIGAGLFIGYKDHLISSERNRVYQTAEAAGRRVTYYEVVQVESGGIQTDDLIMTQNFVTERDKLKKRFSSNGFIKIWGCNSGIDNWVYSDDGVTDPNDNSAAYYWRAFNEFNVPKPSIAQAFANYFKVNVFGASSGSSIQVFSKKNWISSKDYKKTVGHWPSGSLPHRLIPDKGGYHEFSPK